MANRLPMILYLNQLQVINLYQQAAVIIAQFDRQNKKKNKNPTVKRLWRKGWIGKREELGEYHNLMRELAADDVGTFIGYLRMDPDMFHVVVERLRPLLTKQDTHMRKALEVGLKVAVTLRFYATGMAYKDLETSFRIGHNTVGGIINDVTQAILTTYGPEYVKCPKTKAEWRKVARKFSSRWNFHHALGAIDGKHFKIIKPKDSGSTYYNYKGFFSVIMLALVDADYKFLWTQIGIPGATSDSAIFNECDLKKGIEGRWTHLPDPDPLPQRDGDIPYFIIGDDAFAIKTWMMKPYGSRHLKHEERIFNYRLSRARRVVENAFGILVNRFRVFLQPMAQAPEHCVAIIGACVCLHNYMRQNFPEMQNDDLDGDENTIHPPVRGAWRDHANLHDARRLGGALRATKAGGALREELKDYYNSAEGRVAWQERMISLNPYQQANSDSDE